MRLKTIKTLCLFLVLVLLAGCALTHAAQPGNTGEMTTTPITSTEAATQETQSSTSEGTTVATTTQPKPVFLHAEQGNETGTAKSLTEYTDNYAYGVHYPALGNTAVDAQIESEAKTIAHEMVQSVKGHIASSAQDRAIMQADYKTYVSTDAITGVPTYNLFSVVFEIYPGIHAIEHPGNRIKTLLFDMNTGQRLYPEDVFGRDYLAVIAGKTAALLAGNAEYAAFATTELFIANTSAKAENFLSLAFTPGQVVFYFDQGRILPESFGCRSVSIPITDLYKVMRIKAGARAPIRMFDTNEKMVALTFDDGPKDPNTGRLLDALEKTGGRATFFVLGLMIDKFPAVMKRAYLSGNDIGDHTYNHPKMALSMSDDEINYQVTECANRIKREIEITPAYFRMPYGFNNANVDRLANMPIIAWSLDSTDWMLSDTKKKNRSQAQRDDDKQKLLELILTNVQDGDIILMHDIHIFTVEVCETLIPELAAQGFRLVTVTELFDARGIKLENGVHYRSARK